MDSDWRSDCFSLKERNFELLEKGYYSDCNFLVGDGPEEERKVFASHKLILANASAVFQTMFFGSLTENTDQSIKIVDIQPKTFYKMLKDIYTDAVDLEEWGDATDLFNAAKKYMLYQLKKCCIEHLVKGLDLNNALQIYEFSKFHEEGDLIEAALKVIREETISVLNAPSFLTIKISTMVTILDQDQLQSTEMELFVALEGLAKSQGAIKNISQTGNANEDMINEISDEEKVVSVGQFRKAVKKIQFYSMTAEQFSNGPAFSELLLPEEALSIMACLLRPSRLKNLYPKDFQQNIRPSKRLPCVYMDITAGDLSIGRIVIELRSDIVPKTVKLFLEHFPGNKGLQFNQINGSFSKCNGLYFQYIDHENFILKHSGSGTVSVLYKEINGEYKSACCSLLIAFLKLSEFNSSSVVFGHVVEGMDVIEIIKSHGTDDGVPKKKDYHKELW